MSAVKSTLVHPAYKTEYRVRNWREYEQGLRARGDVTIWFSEEATSNWISRSTGARGGPRLYSDLAIETSLMLRTIFGLPLRQAEGFVGSLLRMLGLDQIPSVATFVLRLQTRFDVLFIGSRRGGGYDCQMRLNPETTITAPHHEASLLRSRRSRV